MSEIIKKIEKEYGIFLEGYPKEMMVSDDGINKFRRLVFMRKDNTIYPYKTLTNNGANSEYRFAEDIVPVVRTIKDGLVKGDEIIKKNRNEYHTRLIVGTCDDVVFCRNNKRVYATGSDPYHVEVVTETIQNLIALGFEIVQPETKEEIVRLTHKDISEGKGKGVPSHLIMIVED